jgi:ankyrin repeat protein
VTPTAMEAFGVAVRDNDAARVSALLASHPELKSAINGPLSGGHFGATALIVAAQHANREMIETLLASGADVNQRSHWWAGGFSPLDEGENAPWLADLLVERGAVMDPPTAAQLGRLEVVKALVAADPQAVHARGGDGQTALHRARTVEMAGFLLDHGADIDALDVDHESTPAQYLVRTRQDVARYLVSRGCKTDILMASAIGDGELVRRHLEADRNSIRTRVSPQYFPMRNPHAGGTIYNWTLGWNKNAHVIAREFGHGAVYDLLMSWSPDSLKLASACASGDEPTAQALLASNPALASSLDEDERRMLPDAARDNNTDAVRLMLDAGWPRDARGQHNATALHWACFHGNAVMAATLIDHGAPVNVKGDDYNGTPLAWARHGSVHGWYSKTGDYDGTITALLDAGAEE